jgi:hypothetical protein
VILTFALFIALDFTIEPPDSFASDCENLLVRVHPVTGEFLIRTSSMEFQSWRSKADHQTPDSRFAYQVLDDVQIEHAHGLQSRYATEKNLSALEKAEVIQHIDSIGDVKLPEVIQEEGVFLPAKGLIELLEYHDMLSGKYLLFERGGKFLCYT